MVSWWRAKKLLLRASETALGVACFRVGPLKKIESHENQIPHWSRSGEIDHRAQHCKKTLHNVWALHCTKGNDNPA